jgi:hypothetical protein
LSQLHQLEPGQVDDLYHATWHPVPNELEEDTPGAEFLDGPGHLMSTLVIDAWKH